ncbi:Uncharacterized protein Rs2_27529 [Raphanus sativus]|nr:Uncharacterized protein Rs2_27529 [Raphanus sativus]
MKIVTCDVKVQNSSTRTTEVISIASSGPVETAIQEYKPMRKLKQTLGIVAKKTSLSMEKEYGDEIFSPNEEETRNRTDPNEPIGKSFTQAEYNIICTKRSPVNPPENLSILCKTSLK